MRPRAGSNAAPPEAAGATTRRAVLLLPGWRDRERALHPLARALIAAGWIPDLVRPLGFADPYGSSIQHAGELALAVRALRERTGRAIDVVAHSMGGLALRYYLTEHVDHGIERAIFVATPHGGTRMAWFAFGGARRELFPGSSFLRALGPIPADVRPLCVYTRWDLRVVPGSSARLHDVPAIEIPGVGHRGLLRDRRSHAAILDGLLAG